MRRSTGKERSSSEEKEGAGTSASLAETPQWSSRKRSYESANSSKRKKSRLSTDSLTSPARSLTPKSRSTTPDPEGWRVDYRLSVVFECKEGDCSPPKSKAEREHAKDLIQKFEEDSLHKVEHRTQKTLNANKLMRLDHQPSPPGYHNLQIQQNRDKDSQSVACALIQEGPPFGKELMQQALRKSLETKKNYRLRETN